MESMPAPFTRRITTLETILLECPRDLFSIELNLEWLKPHFRTRSLALHAMDTEPR
jgi:hypothetical protein